mmetsp:Transcript_5153/g.10873  ORF Transcript_5153/g.10873 Transcript_5153/m.10873 type:complete len:358 (-) Transcript_5153:268-1341(-)
MFYSRGTSFNRTNLVTLPSNVNYSLSNKSLCIQTKDTKIQKNLKDKSKNEGPLANISSISHALAKGSLPLCDTLSKAVVDRLIARCDPGKKIGKESIDSTVYSNQGEPVETEGNIDTNGIKELKISSRKSRIRKIHNYFISRRLSRRSLLKKIKSPVSSHSKDVTEQPAENSSNQNDSDFENKWCEIFQYIQSQDVTQDDGIESLSTSGSRSEPDLDFHSCVSCVPSCANTGSEVGTLCSVRDIDDNIIAANTGYYPDEFCAIRCSDQRSNFISNNEEGRVDDFLFPHPKQLENHGTKELLSEANLSLKSQNYLRDISIDIMTRSFFSSTCNDSFSVASVLTESSYKDFSKIEESIN